MRIRKVYAYLAEKNTWRSAKFSRDALASRRVKNCLGAKKDKYTSDFFALPLLGLKKLPPILLFGTILLLNLTEFTYTVIWPIHLFGTRE